MERLLYWMARGLVGLLQALPLRAVARLGRWAGGLAYLLDARHRRVAVENLALCFGTEKPPAEIRALARENFRRIGESFCCAARTAAMNAQQILEVLEFAGVEELRRTLGPEGSVLVAVGHFGNFELYARTVLAFPEYQCATTYRALRQPLLNQLMQDLRRQSGCLYFERLTEAPALREALHRQRVMLGLLADQHGGDRGLRLPFLGHDCSTSAAPAVYALRHRCALATAICYRVAPGRWRVEFGEVIPTAEHDKPRSVEAISLDINRAFETAVRRDPANWFWVHRRWKPGKHRGAGAEKTAAREEEG